MSLVVQTRVQLNWPRGSAEVPSGWILWEPNAPLWWRTRALTFDEAVRHEWGEATWTARILAEGEAAGRHLAHAPRRGCF